MEEYKEHVPHSFLHVNDLIFIKGRIFASNPLASLLLQRKLRVSRTLHWLFSTTRTTFHVHWDYRLCHEPFHVHPVLPLTALHYTMYFLIDLEKICCPPKEVGWLAFIFHARIASMSVLDLRKCRQRKITSGVVWRCPWDLSQQDSQVAMSYCVDWQPSISSVLMPPWTLLGAASRGELIRPDSAAAKGASRLPQPPVPDLRAFPFFVPALIPQGAVSACWAGGKLFPFFFSGLPFYQWATWLGGVGRGKDQVRTRVKTKEAAGQKREGEEGSKTIIFSGIQPLLLITFLPQRRCAWSSVTYFECKWWVKVEENLEICLYSRLHLINLVSLYQQALGCWQSDHWWGQS